MEGEADLCRGAGLRALRTVLGFKEGGARPGTRGKQRGASRPPQYAPQRLLAVPAWRRGAFGPSTRAIPDPQTPRAGGAWARRITSPLTVTMMWSKDVSRRKVASSST